ncbi:MAG: ribosome small subunit-dependent GTPase A, partial [Actinomyces sp.]
PGRIERLVVLAEDSGATPLVVLTKIDLVGPDEVDEVRATVAAVAPGVDVLTVSNVTGAGLGEVRRRLGRGRTLALVGPSGTGKSSLVNALVGRELLATGAVRPGDARGRHTTTVRELVAIPGPDGSEGGGGLVLDTPGIRAIGLADATEALERVFADIEELARSCRFADCAHDTEPGCAVQAAVAAGELDRRRVERHRALRAEIAEQAERARRRRKRR